jgi:short-subunit dehydrogenase
VVNNAGVAVAGPFVELPLDDFMWLLDINLRGVIYGCHFFIPPMVARGNGGHVVNISSVAGLVPFREMTAYNAAKFGVLGFSEALRQELSEHDIGVTTMCPGTVSTQIVQHSRAHGYDNPEALRSEGIRHFAEHGIAPERVAARIVRSVGTRGGVRLVGSDARLIFGLHRLLPSVVSGLTNLLRRVALKRADPAASTTEESK